MLLAAAALLPSSALAQNQQASEAPGPALLRALNAARQQGCDGRAGPSAPLQLNPALSDAAARIAGGKQLDTALTAADYRAVRAALINLGGYSGAKRVAEGAARHSCNALLDVQLSEAGFHQRDDHVWLVLAAPFNTPAISDATAVQEKVLELVNAARAQPRQCGNESLPATGPVQLNGMLNMAAAGHASEMARTSQFSHAGQDGKHVDTRATRAGYRWQAIGENIAAGQMQPEAAVAGWLKSPTHCVNLMQPQYTDMGLAFAVNRRSKQGIYWVQVFGKPQ